MRVFALSDPHLSFGTPDKLMERLGPQWVEHPRKMAAAWDERVSGDDLVLVPGDISWARNLEQAAPDLAWLAARPGTKLLLEGNHDYWWASAAKVRAALPEGFVAVSGDALRVGDVAVGGTRLWDTPSISYHDLIQWQGEPISPELNPEQEAATPQLYRPPVARLERAPSALARTAPLRVARPH